MGYIEEFAELAELKGVKKRDVVRSAQKGIEQLEYTAVNAMTTAFGFVIALTWVDTIRLAFQEGLKITGITGTGVKYSVLVAVLVTIFCVLGIVYLPKLVARKRVEETKRIVQKSQK